MQTNSATTKPEKAGGLKGQVSAAKNSKVKQVANKQYKEGLRATAKTLAGSISESVTKNALVTGEKVAKETTKTAINVFLYNTMAPINFFVNNTPGAMWVLKPLSDWLAQKIEVYASKNSIELPISPRKMAENLLKGNYDDLSDEVTDIMGGFLEKSISADLRKAFSEGNILEIGKHTGLQMSGAFKGIVGEVNNIQGNVLTKPFKWLGKKIPFVNKLPGGVQPWVAGGLLLTFGGMIIRGTVKAVKWIIFGAGGIALLNFGKKALMGGVKSQAGSQMGNIMGAMAGMNSNPVGGRKAASNSMGGVMDMINLGTKLMGGLKR
jgi:hypothetical protein